MNHSIFHPLIRNDVFNALLVFTVLSPRIPRDVQYYICYFLSALHEHRIDESRFEGASATTHHEGPISWKDVQKRTFMRWMDSQLLGGFMFGVTNPSKSQYSLAALTNGVALCCLAECIMWPTTVPGLIFEPRTFWERMQNAYLAIKTFQEAGLHSYLRFISAQNIVDGDAVPLLGMIWSIILRLSITRSEGSADFVLRDIPPAAACPGEWDHAVVSWGASQPDRFASLLSRYLRYRQMYPPEPRKRRVRRPATKLKPFDIRDSEEPIRDEPREPCLRCLLPVLPSDKSDHDLVCKDRARPVPLKYGEERVVCDACGAAVFQGDMLDHQEVCLFSSSKQRAKTTREQSCNACKQSIELSVHHCAGPLKVLVLFWREQREGEVERIRSAIAGLEGSRKG